MTLDLVPFAQGLEVTRLIFGCAPIGGLFAEVGPDVAAMTLEETWAQGARTFDTAPLYGLGLAEERLGAFLAGRRRQDFVVCTKVGRLLVDADAENAGSHGYFGTPLRALVYDYSRDGARRSVEESCERLRLDHVDIALVHDPSDPLDVAIAGSYAGLEQLRAEGTVSPSAWGPRTCPSSSGFAPKPTSTALWYRAGTRSWTARRPERSSLCAWSEA